MHTNKEYSNDTQGDHTLPASQHIGENPANGGQLEHLDLPADARVKHERQGSGCILLWYQHKIHRLSMAGGLCTDELHLAIQLELRMDCRFTDKPYVLMTTGDKLPRKIYNTFFTGIPENIVLWIRAAKQFPSTRDRVANLGTRRFSILTVFLATRKSIVHKK
jgi:hypothetical protein